MADVSHRKIPWPRVLVEGAVIVGSILLAFGIEAWWDDRGEAVEEGLWRRSASVRPYGSSAASEGP